MCACLPPCRYGSEPVVPASLQLDTGSTPPGSARPARLSDPLDHDYSDLEDHSVSCKSTLSRFSTDWHGSRRLPRELEASFHSSQSLAHSYSSHPHTISVDEEDYYDHLDPLYDDPAPDNSTLSPSHDRERFYHTLLERSTRRKRREKGVDSDHNKAHRLGLLQELFDDPKYAKLFLNIRHAQRAGEDRKFKRLSLGAAPAVLLNETAVERKEGSRFDHQCTGDTMNNLIACSMPELSINAVHLQPKKS